MDNYKKRCESDSYKIAKSYVKLMNSDWSDKDYSTYKKVTNKTKIPSHLLDKIQNEVIKTKGNFRPIDVYQYWSL